MAPSSSAPLSHAQTLRSFFQVNCRVKDYQAHSSKVHSVDWSCDGRRLASGSFDKTVSIFALDKDRMVSRAGDLLSNLGIRLNTFNCFRLFLFYSVQRTYSLLETRREDVISAVHVTI